MADEIALKDIPELKKYIKTVYAQILPYTQQVPAVLNHIHDWNQFVQRHNQVDNQNNRDILEDWALQGLDIWQGVIEILDVPIQAAGLKKSIRGGSFLSELKEETRTLLNTWDSIQASPNYPHDDQTFDTQLWFNFVRNMFNVDPALNFFTEDHWRNARDRSHEELEAFWQRFPALREAFEGTHEESKGSGLSNHWGFLLNPDHPAMRK